MKKIIKIFLLSGLLLSGQNLFAQNQREIRINEFLVINKDDFDTYFCVVSQEPIEHSIINLVSPIFINEKEKLIGQYVTSEKVEPYLASINKCSTIQ